MSREFEIRREVTLPAPPDQVWRAIATREGQAGWFMSAPEGAEADVTAEEPHRLEQRFGTQAIEYLLEAADGGSTVLRFVHSGMDDDWNDEYEAMTRFGWDMYLFTLGEYLRHFPDRPAVYAEAEAPATPSTSDGLRDILAAFGDPAVGDTVDTPIGEAVVDIRDEHFLGLRARHAMVRFHERSLLGMPVAVGHHDYDPGADAGKLIDTWTGWLADTVRSRGGQP